MWLFSLFPLKVGLKYEVSQWRKLKFLLLLCFDPFSQFFFFQLAVCWLIKHSCFIVLWPAGKECSHHDLFPISVKLSLPLPQNRKLHSSCLIITVKWQNILLGMAFPKQNFLLISFVGIFWITNLQIVSFNSTFLFDFWLLSLCIFDVLLVFLISNFDSIKAIKASVVQGWVQQILWVICSFARAASVLLLGVVVFFNELSEQNLESTYGNEEMRVWSWERRVSRSNMQRLFGCIKRF